MLFVIHDVHSFAKMRKLDPLSRSVIEYRINSCDPKQRSAWILHPTSCPKHVQGNNQIWDKGFVGPNVPFDLDLGVPGPPGSAFSHVRVIYGDQYHQMA